jgi:RecA/RadA recombinase
MSKKTELKAVEKESPSDNMEKLKDIARKFSSYMNNQYKEAVSYTPDTNTIARVTVSKWLKMPKAFAEGSELPGLPIGNITHVYGKPNTGKTTFLMEAIGEAQKQGILPILILTEHKFDFTRLYKFMGADPEAMLVFHADNIEQAYGYMEKILRDLANGKIVLESEDGSDQVIDMTNQDCFIFFDSIGNTMSETEMEYEIEDWDKSMGKPAKALKNLTKRINHLLAKVRQRCGILLLNQSYMSMPSYGPAVETPYGGDGVPFSCVLNLRFKRVGDLKMTQSGKEVVIGLETKIEVKKNHVSHLMPIFSVYTVASGMIPSTKESLDEFKKNHLR